MSRKDRVYKKNISTTLEYSSKSQILSKFINCLMFDGKKSVAERVVAQAFTLIKKDTHIPVLDTFHTAINNVAPVVYVISIRIAGSNYQVPIEVPPHKQITLSIKWLIACARNRSEKTMPERLAKEIIDAYNNIGRSIEKKQTVHKMAEANRAYAHYRW
jgi:small subunit ribosomal protein S7